MELKLVRYRSDSEKTFGKLYIDGVFECFTLEDQYQKVKVHGETRIPAGTYDIGLRISPKFSSKYGHEMLWIKDVPGFQYILIHKGNTDADTQGCVLVGAEAIQTGITKSKIAYDALYPKVSAEIKNNKKVTITVIDKDK